MSGKFMKIKRIVIPTLTLVIIASQLMGCAATSQGELMTMLNTGQEIEIEIAEPAYAKEPQGEKQSIDWVQLDQLKTYADFRSQLDDLMKITSFGQGSKNGICYIDLEGNQEGNNTLYNAFMNRKFITNFYENDTVSLQLQQIINSVYVDVDTSDATIAAINAYWNLLPNATPNFFNGDSTISRLEAMSLIARASNQVTEDIDYSTFESAVGESEFAKCASLVQDDSYLSISDKSLNDKTANGTITRGEYIYMLINNVFGLDRAYRADMNKAQFNDCKDAGDIASQQKLKDEDLSKDLYTFAELRLTLDNPDKGCPTKMYRAIVTAQELGIIGNDTDWDVGLTKKEAIQLYVDTLQAYTTENGYPINAIGGQSEIDVIDENEYATATAEEAKEEYTITEMNLEMQATQNAMTYEKPDGNTEVSGVRKDEIIAVIGKVDDTDWYQIDQEGFKSFIDSKYLKEIDQLPEVQQPAENENNNNDNNKNNQNTQSQVQTPPPAENPQPPVVDPPAEDPQPPVVNPPAPSGDGECYTAPDGSLVFPDGTVLHVGDTDQTGDTYMGNGDSLFEGYW